MGKHRINDLTYPSSIGGILLFATLNQDERKEKNYPTIMEDVFGNVYGGLGWVECRDVMYSFPSLYAIGLFAYNPGKIIIDQDRKKTYLSLEGKNVWNKSLLKDLCKENSDLVKKLNENEELKTFAKRYFLIGNIMPIWPDGNIAKGKQENQCFDIPELFYGKKHKDWFGILSRQFPNAYLDTLLDNVNAVYEYGLRRFLESLSNPEKYTEYLEHVNKVVEYRTKNIEAWLKENAPDTGGLRISFSDCETDLSQ